MARDARNQLRAIRDTAGWREAAKVAGIPKRVAIANPSNPSGRGFRTLSPKNRRDRLQRLIGGQVRADGSRDFTAISKKTDKGIRTAMSDGDKYKEARLVLAVQSINREKAAQRATVMSDVGDDLTADELEILTEFTDPLDEAEIESLRGHLERDDWASFKAEYDSIMSDVKGLSV